MGGKDGPLPVANSARVKVAEAPAQPGKKGFGDKGILVREEWARSAQGKIPAGPARFRRTLRRVEFGAMPEAIFPPCCSQAPAPHGRDHPDWQRVSGV